MDFQNLSEVSEVDGNIGTSTFESKYPDLEFPVSETADSLSETRDTESLSNFPMITIEEAHAAFQASEHYMDEDKDPKDPPKYKGTARARGWAYTCNNPRDADWQALIEDNTTYVLGQVEVGEETKTAHIQALLYYNTQRVKPVKKHPRAWLEPVRDLKAYMAYVSKVASRVIGPFERGTRPRQGARSDLDEVATAMVSRQQTLQEVRNENPGLFVRFHSGLKALDVSLRGPRDPNNPCTVMWIWGTTGTGKSEWGFKRYGIEQCYVKDGTKWWDGYTQQRCIIIDDFDGEWPYRDFLRLLDVYPYQGQIKHGYIHINSEMIVITCEFAPTHYWVANELAQVMRRINRSGQVIQRIFDPDYNGQD